MGQKTCSPPCAIKHGRQERVKAFDKETKRRKAALKTQAEWIKDVQVEFNKFIRARDYGKPCISCQRNTGAKVNAGHYKPVGGFPELRFNEINCHLQCEHCNTYLSGNLTAYRINLIEKIGLPLVEWLEAKHSAHKPNIEELKWLKKHYKEKTRDLQREMEQ
jgi:hypothetical protein